MNAKKAKKLRRAVAGYADVIGLDPVTEYRANVVGKQIKTVTCTANCVRGFYQRAKRDES